MKTLTSTPLFGLLEKAVREPHCTTDGLAAAYDDFVMALESFCESGVSYARLSRTLCYTLLELHVLQTQIDNTCGAGKKCGHYL